MEYINLSKVLSDYADKFIKEYRNNLSSENINATSDLYNSVSATVSAGKNVFSVEVSLNDYWKYVENGRGPGKFPPPDAIKGWIKAKNITPSPIQVFNKSTGLTRIITPTENQLSYLIGRKIANEGTPARNVLEKTQDDLLTKFHEAIEDAIRQDVEENINQIISGLF